MVQVKINATEAQIKKLLKGQTVQLKHSQLGNGLSFDLHPENLKKILHSIKHQKGTRIALSDHEMDGNGILGKKFDRFLKKTGIKKAVYSAGEALKPLAHELIKSAGTVVDAYAPSLGSMGASMASNYIDNPDKYQQMWKNGDSSNFDQSKLGTQIGTKAAEILTAKMAERAAKQSGGRIRRKTLGGSINPYMPVSLSGGAIRSGSVRVGSASGRPPIQLRDDQSNFITANSNAFFPLLPKTVASFQRGGSFKM